MKPGVLQHVAGERDIGRGEFPLRLARQALARPFGEGRRFIEADVADRLGTRASDAGPPA